MMELTFAKDAEFGFLPEDSRHLSMDPLAPGQKALAIVTQDGEGITLIGTPEELKDFAADLTEWLQSGPG